MYVAVYISIQSLTSPSSWTNFVNCLHVFSHRTHTCIHIYIYLCLCQVLHLEVLVLLHHPSPRHPITHNNMLLVTHYSRLSLMFVCLFDEYNIVTLLSKICQKGFVRFYTSHTSWGNREKKKHMYYMCFCSVAHLFHKVNSEFFFGS